MRIHIVRQTLIVTLENKGLKDVSSFAYLVSVISTDGSSKQDAQTRFGKARSASLKLRALWKSKP